MRREIRFSGFGGQGVILMGHIMGKACVLDGMQVTLTQSYGPEARGGACSTDVIVSDGDINYPQVRKPDILVCMSQSALEIYSPSLERDGLLLVDTGLVELPDTRGIPATDLADKEFGTRVVSNMIMLGYFTAITGVATPASVEEAIGALVPVGTEDLNIRAFRLGLEKGRGE